MVYRLLLVSSLVLSVVPAARAADQTVLGSALTVKDPGASTKRKITVSAKESATDDALVGDPTTGGATVTISANGASPSAETYTLPAGTSPTHPKPFWSGDAAKGFKYSDSKGENGPVRGAQIKRSGSTFLIKIAVDGKLGPIAVVPPNPGTDGCVLLTIVGGDSYSVRFATGQVTNKGASLFKVAKPTGEGSCVPPTTTTSTTTSTSSSTSTSESTSTSTSTTTTSSTSTSTSLPAFPYRTPPGDAPLRYRDPLFGGVSVTHDVTYGSSVNLSMQTVTLLFDFYEPTGDTETLRPLIIWIHGGSFATGDKDSGELVDEAITFAKEGYVNASITYRLEPPGCVGPVTLQCLQAIVEAFEDAQQAVRFFRTNAATYGIDDTRIAIGGSSAGAITALNVGYGTSEDPTAAVAAVVSLSGAHLLNAIGTGDAPSFLMHGTSDTIVPYQWAVNTVNQATAAGLDSFLTTWPGAGHVPYVAHRTEILTQQSNFLYWEMDLANAAQ